MARLPSIITVEAAHVENVNRVFSAMGKGDGTLSRAAIPADTVAPSPSTPATHYVAQDMGADAAEVAVWQAMCNGDLPQIEGTWGENGVIGAAEAQTALAHMQVASEAGLTDAGEPEAFLAGILLGKNLMFRPEPVGVGW